MENKNKVTEETRELYSRECPTCGEKIYYNWRTDFYTARKKGTNCPKCYNTETRFKKGHNLNDIYSIRENSLDKLLEETPESFYWLGFLIADGSFYDNRFELSLAEKDKEHLEKFANFIGFNKELAYRKKTKSYRLMFSNKNSIPIVMDKYGIIRNKTYNPIDFSIFEKYPKELIMSMLIGIIDGDGNIQKNRSSNAFTIDISSHRLWVDFYNNLIDSLKICARIKNYNSKPTIQSIKISKKEEINILYKYIKLNELPILNRKWFEIFEKRIDLKLE